MMMTQRTSHALLHLRVILRRGLGVVGLSVGIWAARFSDCSMLMIQGRPSSKLHYVLIRINCVFFNDANSTADVKSSAVYRDASAWYHIILAVDTIQGTPANRIKLYVNGEQITALATSTYPDQNTDMYINAARAHQIGTSATSTQFFDGYLAEVNFIDGEELDPSSFGETKSGVWVPKEYAGTYAGTRMVST
jgi:hypothetical protein